MLTVGDILYLHDSDTMASDPPKNILRWCMVLSIAGSTVRVVPRSASRRGPVSSPALSVAEFTKDGWFSRRSLPVPLQVAEAARNVGQLPERDAVIALLARRPRR